MGVKVLTEKCDITDGTAVATFVKKTRDQFGGVDVAVNIAGMSTFGATSSSPTTTNGMVLLNQPAT